MEKPPEPDALKTKRDSIDNIDTAIIHLLAERFKVTRSVSPIKAEHGLPVSDKYREKVQLARWRKLAEERGIDPDFIEKYWTLIVHDVIAHHVWWAENNPTQSSTNPNTNQEE